MQLAVKYWPNSGIYQLQKGIIQPSPTPPPPPRFATFHYVLTLLYTTRQATVPTSPSIKNQVDK